MNSDLEFGEEAKLLEDRSSVDTSAADALRQLLQERRSHNQTGRWHTFIVFGLIVALVGSNLLWASFPSTAIDQCPEEGKWAAYYGSPAMSKISFDHDWHGLVDSENDTHLYRQEEWGDKLMPKHGGVVALSSHFVSQHNLPRAANAPEDPDKMIYLVAGYHQLHCASVLRNALYFLNGTISEWPDEGGFLWDHVLHCMDAVRQVLACNLDPTLIPLDEVWPGIPNGQLHMCRNRDKLRAWCNDHGHDIPVDPKASH